MTRASQKGPEADLPLFGKQRAYRLRGGKVVVHTATPGGGYCRSFENETAFRKACPEIPPETVWRSKFAGAEHGGKAAGRKEERR